MAKIEEDERIKAKEEDQEMMAKSESPVFDTPEEAQEMLAEPVKVPDNLSDVTDRAVLKQHLLEAFDTACDECGGPAQWLLHRFPKEEDRKLFRAGLEQEFPMMASIDYVQPAVLGKSKQRCHVHVAMLSFQPERSTKGFPYRCTCKDLLDEYLVHGFLTEAEPLLLWSSPDDRELSQADFEIRYVKGMARCSTLLWLLARMADLKIDVMANFPHLYQTVQVIHGLFESHPDLMSVAIANAHTSNRGAIRAPHDVLTWVTKLLLLDQAGAGKTPSQILEAFNSNASAKGKVTGQRRVSALNLLQGSCKKGVDSMVKLLSQLGNKAVWWHEDSFCNKKLLPGWAPRANLRQWNQILAVTEISFSVFVESLNMQQLLKSSRCRRPLDKCRLEEHAQMCSFWCWATQGAMENAVDKEKLASLSDKFRNGDVAMTLDVQSLLHERKHDIQWSDLFPVRQNVMIFPFFHLEDIVKFDL